MSRDLAFRCEIFFASKNRRWHTRRPASYTTNNTRDEERRSMVRCSKEGGNESETDSCNNRLLQVYFYGSYYNIDDPH